jgi:hypothetical protein
VATGAGQQQHPAKLRIVDKLRPGAAERCMELVARGVLGVVAEDVRAMSPVSPMPSRN